MAQIEATLQLRLRWWFKPAFVAGFLLSKIGVLNANRAASWIARKGIVATIL